MKIEQNVIRKQVETASLGQRVVVLCIKKTFSINRQKEKVFKCRTCEQVFNLKFDLMKHRKLEHSENVESCFYAASGTCTFGVKTACLITIFFLKN